MAMDFRAAAAVLGLSVDAVRQWFQKQHTHNYVKRWYSLVKHMRFVDVKEAIPSVAERFSHIPDDATVDVSEYDSTNANFLVCSKFDGTLSASEKGALLNDRSRSETGVASATARQHKNASTTPLKHIRARRKPKYPTEESIAQSFMQLRWDSGDPASRQEIYDEVLSHPDTTQAFLDAYGPTSQKTSAKAGLAGWLTRVMERAGFSERKKTVSQLVPDNWESLVRQAAASVRETMQDVDVLLNADQTFVLFNNETERVAAKRGARRIGSNVKYNPKKGCTLMVTVDSRGILLKPFLVLDGKFGKTLHQRYLTWDGPSEVAFQERHWFDDQIVRRYLEWLRRQYPTGTKVGLVWDMAPCHKSRKTEELLQQESAWLKVCSIPGGVTSLCQPCDLVLNAQIKQELKRQYFGWRLEELRRRREANPIGYERRIDVPRDDFIRMVEGAMSAVSRELRGGTVVQDCFKRVGFNPFVDCTDAFEEYVRSLKSKNLYKSLHDRHQAELEKRQVALDLDAQGSGTGLEKEALPESVHSKRSLLSATNALSESGDSSDDAQVRGCSDSAEHTPALK
eukprot:scaffold2088_cov452-Pinguiococcus_pyrenoidosus.AAC.1